MTAVHPLQTPFAFFFLGSISIFQIGSEVGSVVNQVSRACPIVGRSQETRAKTVRWVWGVSPEVDQYVTRIWVGRLNRDAQRRFEK